MRMGMASAARPNSIVRLRKPINKPRLLLYQPRVRGGMRILLAPIPSYISVMNATHYAASGSPTRVRYGVLGFACSLSMITYLDRVCFGTVAPYIQSEFGLTDTQKGMLFSAFAPSYVHFEV